MSAPIQSTPWPIQSVANDEMELTFDECKSLACVGYAQKYGSGKPTCDKHLKIGIFFDGTNNNRQRDKLDHRGDRKEQCHSNIVSLFDAHKDARGEGAVQDDECYRFYVPGVGTRFEEGFEYRESTEGKAMAKGGQARILFAVLQVYNAIHRAFNSDDAMFKEKEIAAFSKTKCNTFCCKVPPW
jgi:hypothetical protein